LNLVFDIHNLIYGFGNEFLIVFIILKLIFGTTSLLLIAAANMKFFSDNKGQGLKIPALKLAGRVGNVKCLGKFEVE